MALTPLPVPTIRILSVLCTVGTTAFLLLSFPEVDNANRPHVFTAVTRQLKRGINAATSVDETEAAAIRRQLGQESQEPQTGLSEED